jgi:DNA-binding transcriptional regulator YdaS (Cro superfamily)
MAAEVRIPHVARAVDAAGSQRQLADVMGCAQQTVSKLLNGEITIDADWALRIERATGGSVSRHDLRPDLFGPHPAPTEAAA